MRTTVLAGAVLGIIAITAAPAVAAAPEIQQKSCEANGGTFSRDQGTKSCTTTTVDQTTSTPSRSIVDVGSLNVIGERYTGVGSVTSQIQTTTTQTQKGNGDVTTIVSMTVLSSSVNEISCTVDEYLFGSKISSSAAPFSACEGYYLFPHPLPLGPLV
jgi:hypothetical protein